LTAPASTEHASLSLTRRSSDLIAGRILQAIAPCQAGLVKQDPGQVVETLLIGFLIEALQQRMIRVDFKDRLGLRQLLTRRFHNRSEEHTSELQSRENLVCRLLL